MKIHPRVVASAAAAVVLIAGVSRANAPAGRYTVTSGTVYDTKTKLTWQQTTPAATYTWGAGTTSGTAQSYCASLSLSGTGWRVPTRKELQTLVDYSEAGGSTAMIDSVAFPSAPVQFFWSASPVVGSSVSAWYVSFIQGFALSADVSAGFYVRCVR